MAPSRKSVRSAAAAIVGVVLCGYAAPARAYCREVTAAPPIDFDPMRNGCFGAGMPTLFWRNACTNYSVQRDASPKYATLAQARAIAQAAFAAWTNAACPQGGSPSIQVDEFPPVSCNDAPSMEHNNPIIFRDDSWPFPDKSNALGFTTLTVDLTTGEILGAAIEINTASYPIVLAAPAPAGSYDLPTILTHEAGHFFGLAHSDSGTAVMYAYYNAGTSVLTADDVAGICSIYSPVDGSRNTIMGAFAQTPCDPDPPLGFSDACGTMDAGTLNTVGSGPPADPAASATSNPCPVALSCSLGRATASGAGAALVGVALSAAALFVRRARRRSDGSEESCEG